MTAYLRHSASSRPVHGKADVHSPGRRYVPRRHDRPLAGFQPVSSAPPIASRARPTAPARLLRSPATAALSP